MSGKWVTGFCAGYFSSVFDILKILCAMDDQRLQLEIC